MTTFATTAFNAVGLNDADLVNVATRVVAIPMREFYGLLWQAGVLHIADCSDVGQSTTGGAVIITDPTTPVTGSR